MIALGISAAVSMLVSILGTPLFIRWLRAQGIGQEIRDDGPQRHLSKKGTPPMGGLMIVSGAVAGYVVAHLRSGPIFTRAGLFTMFAIIGAATVGLLDDWIKVRHKRSLGLNKRAKIGGQLLVATIFAIGCVRYAHVSTQLTFTRVGAPPALDLTKVGWVIFAVFVIVGTTNGVNLADGLDGLAAGSAGFAFSALTVIAFWQFRNFDRFYHIPQALDLGLIAAAMVGGCLGFLWWNAAPAQIFMGDVGALGIGAALACLALTMKIDLLLPILGGLYVVETLSVIIQVFSFRVFHKRVFRMAPIHHHFELKDWPETTVTVRFWLLSGMTTAVALALFFADFLHHTGRLG